jgi:hypothetical protein
MAEGINLSVSRSKREPTRMRRCSVAWMMIYLAGYVTLLAWFKWVDVYHSQFATTGLTIAIYNVFRVAFIFYLFWIVHAVGTIMLRLFVNRDRIGVLPRSELFSPDDISRYLGDSLDGWKNRAAYLGRGTIRCLSMRNGSPIIAVRSKTPER